jgi:hypothetical protein
MKVKKMARLIYTNAEMRHAENSTTPIRHFTIIAKNLMVESSLKILFIMAKFLKVHPKTEADLA